MKYIYLSGLRFYLGDNRVPLRDFKVRNERTRLVFYKDPYGRGVKVILGISKKKKNGRKIVGKLACLAVSVSGCRESK